ncbi:hypothetical protein [Vibrio parahaemolyticus]|uniref:hypothetical protein n=1 Tax=Vibrio parahaemolyticus TaxID=670 RepID=UPI00111EA631|nr:hypothetical protein [Vibrio parahaemolyticus]EIA1557589.1 hypothetical protein [Vibrio parahaemolyticus]EJG0913563.1 hypothetical protein [Vibrio parahaemolyticus]TOM10375.1 hypothetical protein CGH83_21195 [Vibrio parahaemolyticus]TOM28965.1 hypothetical protein CGH80_23680 [Vibrio parahaemolyticus]TOM38201.1 hypothetical protein CGH77_23690 [Vibrio parahaemolyticus]
MKKIAFLGLLLFPLVSHAEVSDKIPTLVSMWATSLVLGTILFLASIRFSFPLLIAAVISVFLAYGFYDMYTDVLFREAVIAEKGGSYFLNGFGSSMIVFILAILGRYISSKESSI